MRLELVLLLCRILILLCSFLIDHNEASGVQIVSHRQRAGRPQRNAHALLVVFLAHENRRRLYEHRTPHLLPRIPNQAVIPKIEVALALPAVEARGFRLQKRSASGRGHRSRLEI